MRRNEGGIFNLDNFDEMSNADVAGSLIFSLVTVASAFSIVANVKLSNVIDDIRNNPDSEDLDKLDVSHPSSMVYLTPAVSLIATLAFVFSFRSQNAHGKIASRVASGVVSAASIITSGVDLDRASNKLYEYITDRDLPESLSGDAWHAAGFSRVFATTDQVVGAFGLMATAFAIYNFMKRDNNQIAPDPAGEGAQELTDRAVEAAAREPEVARQQGRLQGVLQEELVAMLLRLTMKKGFLVMIRLLIALLHLLRHHQAQQILIIPMEQLHFKDRCRR